MKKRMLKQQGFTLIEMMVSIVIGLVVVGATFAVYMSQQKGYQEVDAFSRKLRSSRVTVEQISRLLRNAGLGVIAGEVMYDAKKYELTFRGDVDGDVDVTLAEMVTAGSTAIKVDLNDELVKVDSTDYVLITLGEDQELIHVRSSGGEAFDLSGEPDTIYLDAPTSLAYATTGSEVRTIETITIAHDYANKEVNLNGNLMADYVTNLEFRYYNASDTELVPPTAGTLSQTDRVNIRKIDLVVEVDKINQRARKQQYTMSVDLRNIERPSLRNNLLPPAPPSNLQITEHETCGHFTIAWTKPTEDGDGGPLLDLAGYRIYYGDASGNYYEPAFPVSDEAVAEMIVDDKRLISNQVYFVTMTAYDLSFNESNFSEEISFTLQDQEGPPPPTVYEASSEIGSVTLTWQAPQDAVDIYGYRIYRGTQSGFNPVEPIANEETLTASVFEFTDTDVDPCMTYYYRIASVDCENVGEPGIEIHGDGDGFKEDFPTLHVTSTTPNEDPVLPPAVPEGASASGQNEAVQLNWINPADMDFAGVVVRWSNGGFPYNPQDGNDLDDFTGPAGEPMTVLHDGLANGQTFYYSLFAYDHCGNYSDPAQVSAFTGETGPIVEIVNPTMTGMKVTNGVLTYHARAYDPDEAGLSIPPSLTADNGKGIAQMVFNVDPNPEGSGFPRTEYNAEYCGFGGSTNPCNAGDVSKWCDGTYNLYTVAYDNEGMSNQSSYIEIEVENGGLSLDESYINSTSGAYKQEMNTRLTNTADNSVDVMGVTASWNRPNARLARIEMPAGSTIWTAGDSPVPSGQEIQIESYNQPTLGAGSQLTARFVFVYWYDLLRSGAAAGSSRINLTGDASRFSSGTTIYIGGSESVTIDEVGADYLDLATPLQNGWSAGSTVSEVQNVANSPMATAQLNLTFDYEFSGYSQECVTGEYSVMVADGPVISNPQQDKPYSNYTCIQTVGATQVENFRSVPVHINLIDGNMQGLNQVRVYYKVTNKSTTSAPTYGYTYKDLDYESGNDYWIDTIPYQSNKRIWFYFYVKDNTNEFVREPASGAFTYDHVTDSTPPNCPLGLVATRIAKREVHLSWNVSPEEDILGYNVYRRKECGSYSKVYTNVSDEDSTTPGVQYTDDDSNLNTTSYCYDYYINAVDMQGNQSTGCSVYFSSAGDCPCGS